MPFRAVCLTQNTLLKRTLRRTLHGAGSDVVFFPSADALEAALAAGASPHIIVLDSDSRHGVDVGRLGSLTRAQVMVVGESIENEDVLALLREEALNHILASAGASEEDALLITSGKVFQGDIFGVEKYLAWGALVRERVVATYDAKREALHEISQYAADTGARRQVVARVESVADELLMNALYDAPAIRAGTQPTTEVGHAPRPVAGATPAVLRYACHGRMLGVSVRDSYGELRKEAILDHVARARAMRGTPQLKPTGGAGLGLYFVIASVTRFIANIDPGRMTEVIGLFDIQATGRDQDGCARSLHIFVAPRDSE